MNGPIKASPFHRDDYSLAGFVLSGRWPESTEEWTQVLAFAVRIAAVPGMVLTTAVFRAVEDTPDDPTPDAIGIVTDEGPVLAETGPRPGQFIHPSPPALFVLHPPVEGSRHAKPSAAAGIALLPGIPHLGLDHRAAWVEAGSDGAITKFVSADSVDPMSDPDLAALATLCAA